MSKDSRLSKQSHPMWVLAEAKLSHPLCTDTHTKTDYGALMAAGYLGAPRV